MYSTLCCYNLNKLLLFSFVSSNWEAVKMQYMRNTCAVIRVLSSLIKLLSYGLDCPNGSSRTVASFGKDWSPRDTRIVVRKKIGYRWTILF